MKLRKFNEAGLQQFSDYLTALGADPTALVPISLLTDPAATVELHPAVDVEHEKFASRFECARYLDNVQGPVSPQDFRDSGLWSWMSLFFFEQI